MSRIAADPDLDGGPVGDVEVARHDAPADEVDDRPHIAMALYGDLTYDSRVRREASALVQGGFRVSIVCLSHRGAGRGDLDPDVEIVIRRPSPGGVLPGADNPFSAGDLGRVAAIRRRLSWLSSYVSNLRSWGATVPDAVPSADMWHLHDFVALAAVAPHLPAGTPMVFDSHDLFLETGTALRLPWMARQLLRRYEGRLIRRTTAVVTVNGAVARVLEARYRPSTIRIVRNCPPRVEAPAVRPDTLREAYGIPSSSPVILHHGRLDPQRGVEELAEALLEPGLESCHLVLLGFGETEHYREVATDPRWGGRFHVHDAVAPSELISWVASADISAMPLHDSTMNLYLSTPNKLFESIAAGVPVVASDFPAIREVVLSPDGPLGALCKPRDPASIAAAVGSILTLDPGERQRLRDRCVTAAQTRWNWETEAAGLVSLYRELSSTLAGQDGRSLHSR